ncbi:MAG: hypothetical protein B7C54_05245 [Acidimicrobiales bacterium mtb01]|nr:helix-turn-helix transcriptional regulator [Actinomycetota bacterium]TEX46613.1 MAG: hypothetical protein B7C54_05245 [Acidimicrobiales bacterium mtb01]
MFRGSAVRLALETFLGRFAIWEERELSGNAHIQYPDVMFRGRTLRDLRVRAGLTQAEVARRVGIPSTVVSAYECERRQPSLEVAGRIVSAIGYEIRFDRVGDPWLLGHRLEQVLHLAEALPYQPRPLAEARW